MIQNLVPINLKKFYDKHIIVAPPQHFFGLTPPWDVLGTFPQFYIQRYLSLQLWPAVYFRIFRNIHAAHFHQQLYVKTFGNYLRILCQTIQILFEKSIVLILYQNFRALRPGCSEVVCQCLHPSSLEQNKYKTSLFVCQQRTLQDPFISFKGSFLIFGRLLPIIGKAPANNQEGSCRDCRSTLSPCL